MIDADLIASHPTPMLVACGTGVVELANEAFLRLCGVQRDDVIGHPVGMLLDDSAVATRLWHQLAQEGRAERVVARVRGRELHLDASAHTAGGRVSGVLICAQEALSANRLADARRMALEHARARADLAVLVASVGHDVKEPMRQVRLFAELLRSEIGHRLEPTDKESLDFVCEGAERALELLRGLVAYLKLGENAAAPRPTDLEVVVRRALAGLRASLDEAGATVVWDELPWVIGEDEPLSLLFQNLLSNALKYRGDDPPRISVETERRGAWCEVRVRDNGRGFDPRDAERIFELFKRGRAAGRDAGSGVGLAICRRIAEAHGGSIDAQSTPGAGSTFRVTLPAAAPQVLAPPIELTIPLEPLP